MQLSLAIALYANARFILEISRAQRTCKYSKMCEITGQCKIMIMLSKPNVYIYIYIHIYMYSWRLLGDSEPHSRIRCLRESRNSPSNSNLLSYLSAFQGKQGQENLKDERRNSRGALKSSEKARVVSSSPRRNRFLPRSSIKRGEPRSSFASFHLEESLISRLSHPSPF
jgi:hypothetical protein